MAYITLQEAKAHLRVDYDEDDNYIVGLISMVHTLVELEIGDVFADLEDTNGLIPLPLKQAMLLMIGHFYSVREPIVMGISVNEIPYGYKFLIAGYKNYTVG